MRPKDSTDLMCFGRGECECGKCKCQEGYWGGYCQHEKVSVMVSHGLT